MSVIPSIAPRTGGPATGLLAAIRPLRREGIETTVIATDMGRAASASSAERISLTELERHGASAGSIRLFRTRRPYRLAFAPGIQRALRREQGFDLVRIHSLFLFPQYAAWRYCRRTSTPYIVSIHGALDPYLRERGRFRKQLTECIRRSTSRQPRRTAVPGGRSQSLFAGGAARPLEVRSTRHGRTGMCRARTVRTDRYLRRRSQSGRDN